MAKKTVSLNTMLGSAELPFEVKITNTSNGKVVYALSHNITDFEIETDIFSYKHTGYIVVRDEFGVQLGLDDVPKVGPLELKITLNETEYGETFISKGVTATKTDLASRDVGLRIDFTNLSSVLIDQAFLRCKIDAGQKVGDFLKDKLESIGLNISTDNWISGDMTFQEPHFFLGKLQDIIEEIKAMDMKRDTGNVFMCYCDFDGNMCYAEISDRIRKASSDKTNLNLMVAGGTFSSGGLLSPDVPAAWVFTSTDLDSLIDTSNGFKFYHYHRHKKLMIPSSKKEGTTSLEVLEDLPYLNTDPIINITESNRGLDEYMIAGAGTEEMVDDYKKLGKQALSRNIALNDWFNNNVYNVKVGFINTQLEINKNVGITVKNVNNELFNKSLCGDWLLAGMKQAYAETHATTELYLIRNGIQTA